MRFLLAAIALFGLFQLAAVPARAADASHYSTADTPIGTLLDDPAAVVIIDKIIPGFSKREGVDQARPVTFQAIQAYVPDEFTDERLAKMDEEFAKLPPKK